MDVKGSKPNDDQLLEILLENEKANLGYYGATEKQQNANNVCVLVASFQFDEDKKLKRTGNEADVKNLKNSFHINRKCRFIHLKSPKLHDLFKFISSQEELSKNFKIEGPPSVFAMFILSHGEENGIIWTDHIDVGSKKYEKFTTQKVTEYIRALPDWNKTLKIMIFGCCRGTLEDCMHGSEKKTTYDNRNACQLTTFPGDENFVIVYPTVETTVAYRNNAAGTWLVNMMCNTLDGLENDMPLENVLAIVQSKISNITSKENEAQTPEVKYMAHKQFIVHRSTVDPLTNFNSQDASKSNKNSDEIICCSTRNSFFGWKTDGNTYLRSKLAYIIGSGKYSTEIERALRETLGFDTNFLPNSDATWSKIGKNGFPSEVGCFMAVVFANFFVMEDTNEICMRINDAKSVKLSEIIYHFVGPTNEKWIGRPKIFYFINGSTEKDGANEKNQEYALRATNHSGCFACILYNPDSAKRLIEVFENPLLKSGSNILELSLQLLRDDDIERSCSTGLRPQLVTTMAYKLDFPDWPKIFIEPVFEVNRLTQSDDPLRNDQEKVNFEKLKNDLRKNCQSKNACVWLFTSMAGSGKSTVLTELASFLTREQNDKKVFTIQLSRLYNFLRERQKPNIEEVLAKSNPFDYDVQLLVSVKNVIVLLDGFDEVCPDMRNKALIFAQSIASQKIPLVIATRPQEEDVIIENLTSYQIRKVEIRPFEREAQINLLQKLDKLLGNTRTRDYYRIFGNLSPSSAEILKNPLHLTLIHKIFADVSDHRESTAVTESSSIPTDSVTSADSRALMLGKGISLFDIFEKVVTMHVEDALIKLAFDKTNERFPSKVIQEMKTLQDFSEKFLQLSEFCEADERNIEFINTTGIASVQDLKNIKFLHQTYAEFLVAKSFLDKIVDGGLREMYDSIFAKDSMRQCRLFIDIFTIKESSARDALSIFLLEDKRINNAFKYITSEGLVNIFRIMCKKVTFNTHESVEKKYIVGAFSLLHAACSSNEEISIEMLRMGAHECVEQDQRPRRLCELIEGMASNNFFRLFQELKKRCSDLQGIIKNSETLFAHVTAAKHDHIEMLQELISCGVNLNVTNNNGNTALHWAIRNDNMNMINLLLNNKADCGIRDREGWYCLHFAIRYGSWDTMMLFFNKDVVLMRTNSGLNGIHLSAWNENEKFLKNFIELLFEHFKKEELKKHFYFQADSKVLNTDLICVLDSDENDQPRAEKNGSLFRYFVEKMKERKFGNANILNWAVGFANIDVVQFLVEQGIKTDGLNEDGEDLLQGAAFRGQLANVEYLLSLKIFDLSRKDDEAGSEGSRTALLEAVAENHFEIARILVEAGSDVNERQEDGSSALLLAAKFSSVDMCEFLISKGADVEQTDKDEQNALHHAFDGQKRENVKFFIERDYFSVENKGKQGRTSLHLAASNGFVEIAEILLKKGANVNKTEEDLNATPLLLAAEHASVEMCKLLVENHAEKCAKDKHKNNAMHYAAKKGKLDNVSYLYDLGTFSIEEKGRFERTALHLAAMEGYVDIAKFLIKKGAQIDACDSKNSTPLIWATKKKHSDMCRFLLKNKADINRENNESKSARMIAMEMNFPIEFDYVYDRLTDIETAISAPNCKHAAEQEALVNDMKKALDSVHKQLLEMDAKIYQLKVIIVIILFILLVYCVYTVALQIK
ncbi:uncharacterized protein LOC132204279 [Neocloeon triangulifer]|uniref:uncharacterized protein LOC132204279 n=1 Tax=Neocloeon triangulifer TaxID=2078957 RepID=UPI00286EC64F|nr:uncharacterized protein LOC132204279 [Neocloeon triangulifer]